MGLLRGLFYASKLANGINNDMKSGKSVKEIGCDAVGGLLIGCFAAIGFIILLFVGLVYLLFA